MIKGKKIEEGIDGRVCGQDSMAGIEEGWVRVLDMNYAILPEDINEIVDSEVDRLVKGKIEVFSGNFTGVNPYDENDKIDLNTPFIENEESSSPAFNYILDDVITVIE